MKDALLGREKESPGRNCGAGRSNGLRDCPIAAKAAEDGREESKQAARTCKKRSSNGSNVESCVVERKVPNVSIVAR